MRSVLIKPLFTEKATDLSSDLNKYGFVVTKNANKIEIAREIEKRYDVNVLKVNTIYSKGKTKTQFRKSGRFTGKTAGFKKALVTLKEGQTIEIFEQV
jgi:large subunit ribosomal protein L23